MTDILNPPKESCPLALNPRKEETSFFIDQINTACLSEFSYFVESKGEAVVIDPIRESEPYIKMAESRNSKIKYVFLTHFHADFVSGHLDLAKKTGAQIILGPSAQADFEFYMVKDEEELTVGNISIKVLHTPGHTMESCCFLLLDESKKPYCIFTGDTLFLGEVGRPDLAVKAEKITQEDLASLLYDSLKDKILPLDDELIIYPGHGAGSSCGKSISKGSSCTLGRQRKNNYALQPMTKEEFVEIITANLPAPPKFFFHAASLNRTNYTELTDVLEKSLKPLSVDNVKELVSNGAIIVDCRLTQEVLSIGIIPGSVLISLSTNFAIWIGTLLNPTDKLIVLCDEGKEEEAITRLARVGFENCAGYIEGGLTSWSNKGETVEKIELLESDNHLEAVKSSQEIIVLDVRNPSEWEAFTYKGAQKIPLAQLQNRINELDKKDEIHVLCKSGMRATIAYSLLKKNGFENVALVAGGTDSLIKAGMQSEA